MDNITVEANPTHAAINLSDVPNGTTASVSSASTTKPASTVERLKLGELRENQWSVAVKTEDATDLIQRTRAEYADAFKGQMKKTALSTIEMCRVVYEAKRMLNEGEFADFCSDIGYKDNSATIRKYIAIGKVYPRLIKCVESLPDSWTSIYEITQIPAYMFDRIIDDGKSFRQLRSSDIRKLVKEAAPKQTLEMLAGICTKQSFPFATLAFTKKPDHVDWRAVRKALSEIESRLPVRVTVDKDYDQAWERYRDELYNAAKKKEQGIDFKPDRWDYGREAEASVTRTNDNQAAETEKSAA